jgi:hypothetical protein
MNPTKTDWAHISREISVALSTDRRLRQRGTPPKTLLTVPRVELRESSQKTEQGRIVPARIA